MADPFDRADLIARTRANLRGHEESRAEERDANQLEPGDIIRLRQTSGHEVDWLVASLDIGKDQALILPADTGHLVGVADIKISTAHGARIARCRLGDRIRLPLLDRARQIDTLSRQELSAVLELHKKLGQENFKGLHSGREAELDPAYQEWIEDVVLPACRLVFVDESGSSDRSTNTNTGPFVPQPKQPAGTPWRLVAIAASLLLVLAGAMAAIYIQRLGDQNADFRSKVAELQERLDAALESQPLSNLVVAVGASFRSKTIQANLRPEASHVVLVIPLNEEWQQHEFRLTLLLQGKQIWQQDGLIPSREGELWAGFSSALVEPGIYSLRLKVHDGDAGLRGIKEYELVFMAAERRD